MSFDSGNSAIEIFFIKIIKRLVANIQLKITRVSFWYERTRLSLEDERLDVFERIISHLDVIVGDVSEIEIGA